MTPRIQQINLFRSLVINQYRAVIDDTEDTANQPVQKPHNKQIYLGAPSRGFFTFGNIGLKGLIRTKFSFDWHLKLVLKKKFCIYWNLITTLIFESMVKSVSIICFKRIDL